MKRLNYILLIAFTLSFWGCENALGPQLQDTSIVKTETKWRVSSVDDTKLNMISVRTFNNKGDVLTIINYDNNGIKESTSEFEYKQGEKLEREFIFANGDTISSLQHLFFIQNGKVIKKTTLDGEGTILNFEKFVYDNNGNVTEKLFSSNDTVTDNRISYDNEYLDGSLTIRYTFNNIGSITQKDSIVYSDDQSYFERITSDNSGNIFYSTGYNLNDNGYITSEVIKNEKGQIVDKFIYEFTYFD